MNQYSRIRGEEQPGFLDILGNWLANQSWFPTTPRGRRALTRVGGLRLPPPEGDADSQLLLELHLFEVTNVEGTGGPPVRISVPIALRSRPSALAGKAAFIGKLTTRDGNEWWVYDGARDRAFLAAVLEMARRQQGSRNGRSRGHAYAGFDQREAFTLDLRRQPAEPVLPQSTRTMVQPSGTEDSDWQHKVVLDFPRRPGPRRELLVETVQTLTAAHSTAISRVLGTVTGAWEERAPGRGWSSAEWLTGNLVVIREAGSEAPEALTMAREALQVGSSFSDNARALGKLLGNFHADLAGSLGAYPQTPEQLKASASEAQHALLAQWRKVRDEFDEDEAADLSEVIDLMSMQLRDADEPLLLQRIHGQLSFSQFHRLTSDRWVVSEAGGFEEHAPGFRDVTTGLMSLANVVMEVASEALTQEAAPADLENGPQASEDAPKSGKAEDSPRPVNFGQWYEECSAKFLEGYRASDADSSAVDSVFFRAAMLTDALALFSRWEGQWVFRPSMLLQADN
ncbi:maltokinase N-terminal cap-like domain-containing protein [Nesterenkonia natronophila]|uniref:Maltokinase N-terminal cap domain-containing protein n=1 Tax=Nesterenkonia natronophila TaxID=2174932 RepID=A0A3A4FBW4_9MICC|nr:hypothetical protein [Nesterenkonia natronophila]RJN32294.1 hypothetical protein D3250_00010 [Nesterenkonia natronophila]